MRLKEPDWMEASRRCKDSSCNSCTSNSSHLGYKHVKNTGNSQVLTPGSWKRLLPKVLELARVTGDDNLMTNAQSCAGTCEVRPDKVHTVHVSEPFGHGKHRGLLMEDVA